MSSLAEALDPLDAFRLKVEAHELVTLHPKAALSSHHHRLSGREDDHRLPYQRDVDRIIHSKAFARYGDKTQVVYLVKNDHVATRSLHVQLVSQFARGIASILGLNLNLVEAIALGHDVGHPPFGHEGEGYLSALCRQHLGMPFAHPWQSCRLFRDIEPLNLGIAVYDGFLCHDGGLREPVLHPRYDKGVEGHQRDLDAKIEDPEATIIPMTLEGCLVKVCDTMSYIGRDIEDALLLGLITADEIPQTPLGLNNAHILRELARDLILHSYGKDYIAISDNAFEALHILRDFNFKKIYRHPRLKVESHKIERSYGILFTFLQDDYRENGPESHLWKAFVSSKSEAYRAETTPTLMVVDYIAGMTNGYFLELLQSLILPKRIELC